MLRKLRAVITKDDNMRKLNWLLGLTATLALVGATLTGCAMKESAPEKPITERISELPPVVSPADNPSTPAKVALGAQLFLDKRLSGSGNMSCQGCHYRHLGWTDGNAFSNAAWPALLRDNHASI